MLVGMMSEFYAESGYELNRSHAAKAFEEILADERLGQIWIIQSAPEMQAENVRDEARENTKVDAGYAVVTLKYAMEYGGMMACLDDLYIRAPYRNKGLSTAALAELRELCRSSQIRAISVEVGRDNGPAQTVYRRTGFIETDRMLLMLPLADPTHVQ